MLPWRFVMMVLTDKPELKAADLTPAAPRSENLEDLVKSKSGKYHASWYSELIRMGQP